MTQNMVKIIILMVHTIVNISLFLFTYHNIASGYSYRSDHLSIVHIDTKEVFISKKSLPNQQLNLSKNCTKNRLYLKHSIYLMYFRIFVWNIDMGRDVFNIILIIWSGGKRNALNFRVCLFKSLFKFQWSFYYIEHYMSSLCKHQFKWKQSLLPSCKKTTSVNDDLQILNHKNSVQISRI